MAHKEKVAINTTLCTPCVPQDYGFAVTAADETYAPENLALAVRVQLQNWRQGTVACKSRSDLISRSNRKPWKQKGTGRARAGSPRSPLWRGGGVSHGPQPRVRELKVTKALRRHVLKQVLHEKMSAGQILNWGWEVGETPKTAAAFKALKEAGLADKRIGLFVGSHDFNAYASFGNLPNVALFGFDHPNAFTLAQAEHWVFFKKDEDLFKEMVSSWI
jgi:large subunit ribosomal protein L4